MARFEGSQKSRTETGHEPIEADVLQQLKSRFATSGSDTAGLVLSHRQALDDYASAKDAFSKERNHIPGHRASQSINPGLSDGEQRAVLHERIEILRQQRRFGSLSAMEDSLANIQSTPADKHVRLDEIHADAGPSVNLDDDIHALKSSIRRLEWAVIQADRAAKSEEEQLHDMRRQAEANGLATDGTRASAAVKLRGLHAVREELTRWIEASLSACTDSSEEKQHADLPATTTSGGQVSMDDVQDEYQSYLRTRQAVLDAAARLARGPALRVPEGPSDKAGPSAPLPRARVPRIADTMLAVEDAHRAETLHSSLKQIGEYTRKLLEAENRNAVEALRRLADESQLLPEYPMLTRTDRGRFGRVAESLSGRPTSSMRQDGAEERDEVVEKVEEWAFAADAANAGLETAIKTQVQNAEGALERADGTIADLRMLKEDAI
jgi:hypothetical protein